MKNTLQKYSEYFRHAIYDKHIKLFLITSCKNQICDEATVSPQMQIAFSNIEIERSGII